MIFGFWGLPLRLAVVLSAFSSGFSIDPIYGLSKHGHHGPETGLLLVAASVLAQYTALSTTADTAQNRGRLIMLPFGGC